MITGCTFLFLLGGLELNAIQSVLNKADDHLHEIENHLEVIAAMSRNHALDVEIISEYEDDLDKRAEKYEDFIAQAEARIEKSIERIEALSLEKPALDYGYSKLFFKQPIRVSGGGMLYSPILIPYLDTAETVGRNNFHVGLSFAASSQRVISPKQFNATDIFVDVNDLEFTGFGDVEYLAAINGNWKRTEINMVYGLTRFIDIGARVALVSSPEYALYDSQAYESYTAQYETGFTSTDVEVYAKWRLFSTPGNLLRGAVRADWRFPSGGSNVATSLGLNQFSFSYIVTMQPTYGLTGNFVMGATYVNGESPLFSRPVELSPVFYTGGSIIKRFGDRFAFNGQLDSFTSPYAKLKSVDIFSDPALMFTGSVKYDWGFSLMDFGVTQGLSRSSPETGFFVNLMSKSQIKDIE